MACRGSDLWGVRVCFAGWGAGGLQTALPFFFWGTIYLLTETLGISTRSGIYIYILPYIFTSLQLRNVISGDTWCIIIIILYPFLLFYTSTCGYHAIVHIDVCIGIGCYTLCMHIFV